MLCMCVRKESSNYKLLNVVSFLQSQFNVLYVILSLSLTRNERKSNCDFSFFGCLLFQLRIHFLLICTLAVPILAVLNKAERRQVPFDTYGPPPQQQQLPAPIYGAPAVTKYPSPPPDVPPPVSVPIEKYGPPKVHVEYGPPPHQGRLNSWSACIVFSCSYSFNTI